MPVETVEQLRCTCAVCGHSWIVRRGVLPLRCSDRANCGTFHWNDGGGAQNGRKGKG